MPKYLFYFEKAESVRWLGHLDILRAFERAVRRAELPIAFSLGFNPRVRINFASALSTGITASAEPAVIELVDTLPPSEVENRLNSVLPPGIRVSECSEIPELGRRDLLNSFDRAEYTIVCAVPDGSDFSDEQARAAAAALLNQSEILISRERDGRTKTLDIRPMITSMDFAGRSSVNNRPMWQAVVSIGEGGNVKPGDLAFALSTLLPGLTLRRAHRGRLLTSSETEVREFTAGSVT